MSARVDRQFTDAADGDVWRICRSIDVIDKTGRARATTRSLSEQSERVVDGMLAVLRPRDGRSLLLLRLRGASSHASRDRLVIIRIDRLQTPKLNQSDSSVTGRQTDGRADRLTYRQHNGCIDYYRARGWTSGYSDWDSMNPIDGATAATQWQTTESQSNVWLPACCLRQSSSDSMESDEVRAGSWLHGRCCPYCFHPLPSSSLPFPPPTRRHFVAGAGQVVLVQVVDVGSTFVAC